MTIQSLDNIYDDIGLMSPMSSAITIIRSMDSGICAFNHRTGRRHTVHALELIASIVEDVAPDRPLLWSNSLIINKNSRTFPQKRWTNPMFSRDGACMRLGVYPKGVFVPIHTIAALGETAIAQMCGEVLLIIFPPTKKNIERMSCLPADSIGFLRSSILGEADEFSVTTMSGRCGAFLLPGYYASLAVISAAVHIYSESPQ